MKIYVEFEIKDVDKPDDDAFKRWNLCTGLIKKIIHSTIQIGQFDLVKGISINPHELGNFKSVHMVLTDNPIDEK